MKWDIVVRIIHLLIIAFFIIAPFSGKCDMIVLHAILVPFLYLHWLTNNDTCALTELEKFLCNKKGNMETFVGSIVSPVYKIESNDIKILTLLLWTLSFSQSLQCSKEVWASALAPVRMLIPKSFKR